MRARKGASCSAVGFWPLLGITLSGSRRLTISIRRFSWLLPGATAGPDSPPLRRVARVSSRKSPLERPRPWHLMQLDSKIGLMSRPTSIFPAATRGRFAASSPHTLPPPPPPPPSPPPTHTHH